MKFKPTLYALTFDTASYKAALGKYMTDWLKQAGQEWLYTIVTTVLPTWSGASRATFETIAKELGLKVPRKD